jgi:(S)-ureidoglycine aminohydrolase
MKAPVLLLFSLVFNLLVNAQSTDSLRPAVFHWDSLEVATSHNRAIRDVLEGSTTSLLRLEVKALTFGPGATGGAGLKKIEGFEQLVIVKEGGISVTIGKNTRQLESGGIAFILPGDLYAIQTTGDRLSTCYILNYYGKKPDAARGVSAGGSFALDWSDLVTRETGKGYRRDFFNRPTSQLAQFEMHTTALNADSASHAPHKHVQEEIILVVRGQVTMNINGQFLPASPGDLVFLPANVPHALINTGKEQCEYFAFQWRN